MSQRPRVLIELGVELDRAGWRSWAASTNPGPAGRGFPL